MDRARALGASLLLILFLPAAAAAAKLSGAEARGKRIYAEGVGTKPISVVLLGPGIRAKGKAFPCTNCHLPDGRGVREGGVQSSDISYANLTKEYPGTRVSGRAHPAYTDETLKAAITSCIDPAGTPLNKAHPAYEIDPADLSDLVAYLKILGREPVPGVEDGAIRVGSLLPAAGPLSETAGDVREFLSGYFAELNGRGGIYARKIEYVPVPFDPSKPGSAAAAAREIVASEELFCLVANLGVPAEDAAAGVLGRGGVPVIGPLVVLPENAKWTDRNTFYVYGSVQDQARVMVDFLADDAKGPGAVALLFASNPTGEGGAAGVRQQAARHAFPLAAEKPFPPGKFDAGDVRRLREAAVDTVLFFGGAADALAFLREADRLGWSPRFLAPAAMVGDLWAPAPAPLRGRVYLASPLGSVEPGTRGMDAFLSLAGKHPGSGRHKPTLVNAYAGAELLAKGLAGVGRSVTRAGFVDALSRLYRFETGVVPPLTYTQNRREGARGASIVALDPATGRPVTVGAWREPK